METVARARQSTSRLRGALAIAVAALALLATAPAANADFGISALDGQVTDANGNAYTQAGGHPAAISVQVELNHHLDTDPLDFFVGFGGGQVPDGGSPKDVLTALPPGLIGNPTAVPKCTAAQLAGGGPSNPFGFGDAPTCPIDSQVGVITIETSMSNPSGILWQGTFPLYNMVARPSVPGSFGFQVTGSPIILDATLRSGGDYGLTVASRNIPEAVRMWGLTATFWGVPADPSHDMQRCDLGGFGFLTDCGSATPAGLPPTAFLRMPTSCTPPGVGLQTSVSIDSWENPGVFSTASFFSHLPPNFPDPAAPGPQQGPTDCDRVPFDPTFSATPTSPARADTPSAFHFDLKLPQSDDPAGIGEGDLRTAQVTLPIGVRISPASADGRAGCSSAQIGLLGTGFPEPNPIRFDTADPTCPAASKLGTVALDTPLLEAPLTGSVYLAAPNDNPFHTLLAIYLVVKGPGVILKLPGKVSADPGTGQITTTFDDSPQLPFSDLQFDLDGGARAPLTTPRTCGTNTTHAFLTSWSGQTVASDSVITVDQGPDGGPCPGPQFKPGFEAGTTDPVAGATAPFGLRLTRSDQDDELASVQVALPKGLLAHLNRATLCTDQDAQADSCPDSSLIGHVTVGAGAGPDPFYIQSGRAYLTGPYKGAPFGLAFEVPAVAGPFDLGNVLVRAAVAVDRATTQLTVTSDPLPTILQGIPLELRDLRVLVDRPGFSFNPTDCTEQQVTATATATTGAQAALANRFQVGDCASLGLGPKLSLTLSGRKQTTDGAHPQLDAQLLTRPGDANQQAVKVALPLSLALDPANAEALCTPEAQQARNCPASSVVGHAKAVSVLHDPLEGPVYFVEGRRTDAQGRVHKTLPKLWIPLEGEGVTIDVNASSAVQGGKLVTTFANLPDAPFSSFDLEIAGGRHGILVVSGQDLCKRRQTAQAEFTGHNGRVDSPSVPVATPACAKAKARRRR